MDRALATITASVSACASGALDARAGDETEDVGRNSSDDLRGRTYVVTGAETSALAAACAGRLLRAGARVVCACVDGAAVTRAVRRGWDSGTADAEAESAGDGDADGASGATRTVEDAAGELVTMFCDLERLDTIDGFVRAFCAKAWPLDGLLNAASLTMEAFELTPDGIERQFAVNHLAHFKLTSLLLDELVRTAAASGREGRVVNVSSNLHHFSYRVRQGTPRPSRGIDFAQLNSEVGYTPLNAYGQSKLAGVLHAWSLSERLAEARAPARCVAVTPGMTEIEFERALSFPGGSFLFNAFKSMVTYSLEDAVITPLWCLTAPALPPGTYFQSCAPAKCSLPARDPRLASRLWEYSEEACGFITTNDGSD